ncbi:MAG: Rrf2 family transcriptional regulator [candidate division Zixibacteria bacterium]|nr:Rrf2 family transcriptional regulator [candidate division Zixibacteria bacterium]
MQFTKAEEYGTLGVLYLAEKKSSSVTPLSEISEAKKIPEKFLAKIFQSLSKSGIVRSHRGVRGGFTLAKDPNTVTIKEILESIQGPYHLCKCIPDINACPQGQECALRDLIVMAEDRLVSVFDSHTLADLVKWQQDKYATPS